MPEKIPPEVLDKLLKLHATYSHSTTPEGEAGNAFGRMRAILAKHKLTFEDFYAVQHRGVQAGGARRNDDSDSMAKARAAAAAAEERARRARAERERKE